MKTFLQGRFLRKLVTFDKLGLGYRF